MYENLLELKGLSPQACIILVGMAGAGKSTVGTLLAQKLGWGHLDTDRLLESYFGAPLQSIFDNLGLEGFRKAEDRVVSELKAQRLVISTGGSVIYGPNAMNTLSSLGAVVFLDVPADTICARVGNAADRGLAIAPGQTLEELYAERRPLYIDNAVFTVDACELTPQQCVESIVSHFA